MKKPTNKQIEELLARGVENIYPDKESLKKVLMSGKKIKLYYGIDPTGPTLHIGHVVQLLKLKGFQDLGHEVIILIGDFTAQIGDPTGKDTTRKPLTHSQVLDNAKNYKKQISKILDLNKSNIRFVHNEKWTNKLKPADMLELASFFTVARLLERDMFQSRIKAGKDIHLHEFLYPVFQAYDAVTLDVDLQIGGSDQMFNMLAGRTLMRRMKNKENFVLTTKLLEDPTGKKMGKTEGNIVRLNDISDEMFGKIMSWTDAMILIGFELLTDVSMDKIKSFKKEMRKGANPRDIKFKLAEEIVKSFFNDKEAQRAGERFERIFKEKKLSDKIEEKKLAQKMMGIIDLVFELKMAKSKSETRRLVTQGAVKIDDLKITNPEAVINIYSGMVVKVGKRRFIKIK